jgi:hypothetical protein
LLLVNGKYSKTIYDNPNYYASLVDILNIQKCNFKNSPFTWVAPLTMFLPYLVQWLIWTLFKILLELYIKNTLLSKSM